MASSVVPAQQRRALRESNRAAADAVSAGTMNLSPLARYCINWSLSSAKPWECSTIQLQVKREQTVSGWPSAMD